MRDPGLQPKPPKSSLGTMKNYTAAFCSNRVRKLIYFLNAREKIGSISDKSDHVKHFSH